MFETVHLLYGDRPDRVLRVAVSAVGREPRITVTAHQGETLVAGGFVRLRDVRRLARAVAGGAADTHVALASGGVLPGGCMVVTAAADGVRLAAGAVTYGPVAATVLAAVCRDVVSWTRLLGATA